MKRLAYAAGALALLVVLLVLLAPALVDTPAVRAEIQRRLNEALHGQVTWDALEVALFPPRGELRKVRIEIPGKLSADAGQANVNLRLWPLLRGRPEISSVSLQRPHLRVLAAGGSSDAPLDAMALYRSIAGPAADALRKFAPDMTLSLDQANVEVGAGFALSDLRARARTDGSGVTLDLAGASTLWKQLSAALRVEYADLAARGSLALDGLALAADLPPATLRAKLRTDGRSALECEFDASLGALVPAAKGRLLLPAGMPPQVAGEVGDVDLAQALALARRKGLRLAAVESAEGRVSAKVAASGLRPWTVDLEVLKSDAAIKLVQLPWKISADAAQVSVTREQVRVTGMHGFVGKSEVFDAAAQIELQAPARLSSASGRATLPLEQWVPWLRGKAPLDAVTAVSGSAEIKLNRLALRFDDPAAVQFEAIATPRRVRAALKVLPGPIEVKGGAIHASNGRIRVEKLQGSLGKSTFSEGAALIELGKTPRVSSASARANVELGQWFPWLKERLPLEEISSLAGSADVTLNRLALRFDQPKAADFDVTAVPRKVSAVLRVLPGPVSVDGGAISAGVKALRLNDVAAAMLDARARVSGTVGFDSTIELALAQGLAGEKVVRWAMERGKVPPHLEPRTPLRFTARRVAWAPKGALEADASVEFEKGPALGVLMAWRPERLELRRVTLKDARSDAVLSATVVGDLVEAAFSGKLQGQSIPAMLRQPLPAASGTVQGAMRVTVDRKQPQRSAAEGDLRIDALDLSWLARRKVLIERAELVSDEAGLRVPGARFSVEDQVFELSGRGRRTPQGPVIDARLESPGVDLRRLLPPPDPAAPSLKEEESRLWPLPLSGRIEVHAAFVQFPRHKVEPFVGVLSLDPQRAQLELREARVCGVSVPLQVEANPREVSVAARISMRDEPLEKAVRCLTGDAIEITGNADLQADLRTKGHASELVRNLTGTAQGEVKNGRVMRFALIGNILSFREIASPAEMRKNGFPYRRMTAKGRFENGEFLVEEAFFDSRAARLAANGRVDLLGAGTRLTVLIAPLTVVERVVDWIPLVNDVFGGTMVALPVSVNGDIHDPSVVPLGPRAVSDQLLGIFERALKLPGKLVPAPAKEVTP